MSPEVGHYYWVRFKTGPNRNWQPGQIQKTNGLTFVARIYDMSHFGLDYFELGPEIASYPKI